MDINEIGCESVDCIKVTQACPVARCNEHGDETAGSDEGG
jgi:hypothetical protein